MKSDRVGRRRRTTRAERKTVTEDLVSDVTCPPEKNEDNIQVEELLPTGSMMFNLALSDNVRGGFQMGKMANVIGDSSSGKTFLCLSSLAEAVRLPRFNKYRLIYDDAEESNEFNMEKLFGKKTAKRVVPPFIDGEFPGHSDTIQDFYDNISDAIDTKKPFIYVLDSFDALDAEEDQKKVAEQKAARKKGTEVKGTYGMAKAKIASNMFKDIIPDLKKYNSILIIISQTRDNIDPLSFVKKTRSGGNALKFYSTHEVWLAHGLKIKKLDRDIGNNVKAKVSKNKLTGKHRMVEFPVFPDYGIDSIRGAIEFLVKEKFWEKTKNTVTSKALNISGTIPKLITLIENGNMEEALADEAQAAWDDIEARLKLNRKPKYE